MAGYIRIGSQVDSAESDLEFQKRKEEAQAAAKARKAAGYGALGGGAEQAAARAQASYNIPQAALPAAPVETPVPASAPAPSSPLAAAGMGDFDTRWNMARGRLQSDIDELRDWQQRVNPDRAPIVNPEGMTGLDEIPAEPAVQMAPLAPAAYQYAPNLSGVRQKSRARYAMYNM